MSQSIKDKLTYFGLSNSGNSDVLIERLNAGLWALTIPMLKTICPQIYHSKKIKAQIIEEMIASEFTIWEHPVCEEVRKKLETRYPKSDERKTDNSYRKQTIPKTLKEQVWQTYVGKLEGKCLVCNDKKITAFDFECAHIEAEAKGGETNVSNLRPICKLCNGSIGTKNMIEFARKHFPQAPLLNTIIENKVADHDGYFAGMRLESSDHSSSGSVVAPVSACENIQIDLDKDDVSAHTIQVSQNHEGNSVDKETSSLVVNGQMGQPSKELGVRIDGVAEFRINISVLVAGIVRSSGVIQKDNLVALQEQVDKIFPLNQDQLVYFSHNYQEIHTGARNSIVITQKRFLKIEEARVVTNVLLKDISKVTHQKNGIFKWDKIIFHLISGKQESAGIISSQLTATYVDIVKKLIST